MEVLKIKVNGVWQTVPAIKGDTGSKGDPGQKGEQGIPGPKGEDGAPGAAFTYDMFTTEQLAALKGPKGEKGDPGTTPVKGVDYYTEADKQEMVQLVLAAIPSAEEVNY